MRFASLGLIIIGTQLTDNSNYLGPAIVLATIDLMMVTVVAIELGHRATAATSTSPVSPRADDGRHASPPADDHPNTTKALHGKRIGERDHRDSPRCAKVSQQKRAGQCRCWNTSGRQGWLRMLSLRR